MLLVVVLLMLLLFSLFFFSKLMNKFQAVLVQLLLIDNAWRFTMVFPYAFLQQDKPQGHKKDKC
jgi:hypothetical protein